MVDILHRIGVRNASPEAVHDALVRRERLAGWWTTDTSGTGDVVGGVLQFRFGEAGGFDMRVADLQPGKLVLWDVVDGPPEWVGTRVRWEIQRQGDWTIVLFAHEGWREPVEFMSHCSTKWATFLLSLKALLEDGSGAPAPDDVKVSDWH